MGRTLSGAAKKDAAPCDSRCTLHQPPQVVSRRVHQRCTNRIDLELQVQASLHHKTTPEGAANASTSTGSIRPRSGAEVLAPTDVLAAELESPLQTHEDPDGQDDTTMPTWSLPPDNERFSYGAQENNTAFESDEDVPNFGFFGIDEESGNEAYTRSPTPSYGGAEEWSETDMGYTSGSEADIETDTETHPELNDLLLISPDNSRAASPVPELVPDHPEDLQREATATPNISMLNDPGPIPHASPEPTGANPKLPDALRAFREWVLNLTSNGDLTVAAAESFLKTLNMCLEKDILRCGPEMDPAHRLPLTLDALRRHVQQPSDPMRVYAMCPNFSCQTLKDLSSMENKPYTCAKCKTPITRQKATRRRGSRNIVYHHVPILRYAAGSIKQQLQSILERPGILEAIERHRQHLQRPDRPADQLEDIQHGNLWRNFKKGDRNFFDDPRNIGFILMCDGFEPSTREGAATYSISAISLCIANLPPELRGLPENKILVGVTPGPHEPNVDTINGILAPMVDELLELWNDGMNIKYSDDRSELVLAALIACACDTPAARKVGGFPGVSARYPCTACWCSHHELHVYDTRFPRRTRKEHRHASKVYKSLPNKSQRDRFITARYEKDKPGGYRYSVLLRLPYWEPSTMVVVDPMHCIFLGLADFQFHDVWVNMRHLRENEELKELQKMVESTIRPRHCGRPPAALGTSAAGSLTSDPLRSLVTIDFPLAIPVLWDKVDINSVDQRAHEEWARRKALEEKKKAEAKKGNNVTREATKARQDIKSINRPPKRPRNTQSARKGKRRFDELSSDSDTLPPDARVLENAKQAQEADAEQRSFISWRMQDADGILLLAINRGSIKLGQEKLIEYLILTSKLRGPERMRPNHHFSSHLSKQIERFGPMHQIWTYSGERLNYMLKNTKSNRHGGGEREMTFASTFHRRRDCASRLAKIASSPEDVLAEWAADLLRLHSADLRGTVGSETLNPHANIATPAIRHTSMRLKPSQSDLFYNAFVRVQPDLPIRRAPFEHGNAPILKMEVHPIREVRLNGRVFSMSSFRDSIIKAQVVESGTLVERVGEIIELWVHSQSVLPNSSVSNTFALVRWYKASPIFAPRSVHLWFGKFTDLDIDIHLPNDYLDQLAIIPVSDIQCHCARMDANLDGKYVWLTIGLERE